MRFKIVLLISLVVYEINCEKYMPEYARIKRAKYYSSPPQRFYRRPPSYSSNGVFSYTPPPGYATDDEDVLPGNPRPYKVSKRPNNEGLSDQDLMNMLKYLSKQDLDKIVELAGEKDQRPSKYNDVDMIRNYKDLIEKQVYDKRPEAFTEKPIIKQREDASIYKENEASKFSLNGPFVQGQKEGKQYVVEYANKESYIRVTTPRNVIYATPSNNQISNIQLEEAESSNPINFVNEYINNELSSSGNIYPNNQLSSSFPNNQLVSYVNPNNPNGNASPPETIEPEGSLPRPVNLREEPEYEVSYTNNVPTVVKSESSSYKLENFGDLPLMSYNSKLHSVSSYHVPHYTVTSPRPQEYGTPQKTPALEVAPPPSVAQAQSDAHLKAIKIWTHRSRGTAYTLHNDGSLSLERPQKPKPKYGYP